MLWRVVLWCSSRDSCLAPCWQFRESGCTRIHVTCRPNRSTTNIPVYTAVAMLCFENSPKQRSVNVRHSASCTTTQTKSKVISTDDWNFRSIWAIVYQIKYEGCLSGCKNSLHFYHKTSMCVIGSVSFNFPINNTFHLTKYELSNCTVLNLLGEYSEATVSFH